MIHLVTDSTAQLTPEDVKKNHLTVVPLEIQMDGKTYKDGIDITRKQFSERLASDKEFPTTSQPPIGSFIEAYEKIQKEDPDAQIISVHLSHILSGTVDTARLAAQQVGGDIQVIDSGSVDCGLSYGLFKAHDWIEEGKSSSEIVKDLNSYYPHVTIYVFIKSFDYLVKGGRASRAVGFVSNLIKLMPVLELANNKFNFAFKCRGKKKFTKVKDELTERVINDKSISKLGISYVDSSEDVDEIKRRVNEARPDIKVTSRLASPVVMTHVGPGGFGFIYA